MSESYYRGSQSRNVEYQKVLNSIRRIKRELSDVEVPVHVHSWLSTYPYPGGGAVFEPAMKPWARSGPSVV